MYNELLSDSFAPTACYAQNRYTMQKIPYPIALAIAQRLKQRMNPHCLRVEIAGSVRRQKAEVGDIEIVAIPSEYVGQVRMAQGSFFGTDIQAVKRSSLVDNVLAGLANTTWIKPGFKDYKSLIEHHGKNIFKAVPELKLDVYQELSSANQYGCNRKHWKGLTWFREQPVILDIFLTGSDNFGVTHFIRTGSKEFNIRMIAALEKRGYMFHDGYLKHYYGKELDDVLFDNIEFCPEESYIFQKAGQPFTPPDKRG